MMKHRPDGDDDERRHASGPMAEVIEEAVSAAIEGAMRRKLCTACTLRLVLSSMLLTLIINEPETPDEEFLDMVGEMLSVSLSVRSLKNATTGALAH